jgi:hypothetical protein
MPWAALVPFHQCRRDAANRLAEAALGSSWQGQGCWRRMRASIDPKASFFQ